jgi:hypothetical protein
MGLATIIAGTILGNSNPTTNTKIVMTSNTTILKLPLFNAYTISIGYMGEDGYSSEVGGSYTSKVGGLYVSR